MKYLLSFSFKRAKSNLDLLLDALGEMLYSWDIDPNEEDEEGFVKDAENIRSYFEAIGGDIGKAIAVHEQLIKKKKNLQLELKFDEQEEKEKEQKNLASSP